MWDNTKIAQFIVQPYPVVTSPSSFPIVNIPCDTSDLKKNIKQYLSVSTIFKDD